MNSTARIIVDDPELYIWHLVFYRGDEYSVDENGYFHSYNDEPAVIQGVNKLWFNHGVAHRDNGPAYISALEKRWIKNGLFHREDGPARVYYGISTWKDDWFLYGKSVSPTLVLKLMKNKGMDLTPYLLEKDKELREAVKRALL